MSKTIYVVTGSTGEYSDRSEWSVVALDNEPDAQRYIKAVEWQYQNIPPALKVDYYKNEEAIKATITLDPGFSCDYTGTHWFICKVELLDAAEVAKSLPATQE